MTSLQSLAEVIQAIAPGKDELISGGFAEEGSKGADSYICQLTPPGGRRDSCVRLRLYEIKSGQSAKRTASVKEFPKKAAHFEGRSK